jgi:hypothetical protein
VPSTFFLQHGYHHGGSSGGGSVHEKHVRQMANEIRHLTEDTTVCQWGSSIFVRADSGECGNSDGAVLAEVIHASRSASMLLRSLSFAPPPPSGHVAADMDVMRAAITGADGTPYCNGFFSFDMKVCVQGRPQSAPDMLPTALLSRLVDERI